MKEQHIEFIKIVLEEVPEIGELILEMIEEELPTESFKQFMSDACQIVNIRESIDKRLAEYRNK